MERQKRAAEGLRAKDGPELLAAVRDLAGTLRHVAEDERLWSDLEEGSASDLNSEQLAQLALLDWPTLLREAGIEDNGELADELIDAIARGPAEQGAWNQVREQFLRLADLLAADAESPEPVENRRWWRKLRDRAAYGVSALRRVSVAAILRGAVRGAAEASLAQLVVMLITGAAFGPALPIIAAAVGGLALATIDELGRCLAEERSERSGFYLDGLFEDRELQPGGIARYTPYLAVIDGLAGKVGDPAFEERIFEMLCELRRWGAHVGAKLASAWPFVATQIGGVGVRDLGAVAGRLADFRGGLLAIAEGVQAGVASTVSEGVRVAQGAFEDVQNMLRQLDHLLAEQGFGAAH